MNAELRRPLIFNIHRYSLDDGPGIRTTVFLKGCPLSCIWCHNPESIKVGREIAFYRALCINCEDCKTTCIKGAIDLTSDYRIDRNKCDVCGLCAEGCPSMALKIIGKYYSVEELVDKIMEDRVFYETSKGGVTFSGGEPTLYMGYVGEAMEKLKKNGFHIAIQTSGMFDFFEFKTRLLPFIDLIYYDIKLFDPVKHKEYTGKGNSIILSNFVKLKTEYGSRVEIIARIPLVPQITATNDNLMQIAEFLRGAGCKKYALLSYNPGGITKRAAIGDEGPLPPDNVIDTKEEKRLRKLFNEGLIKGMKFVNN